MLVDKKQKQLTKKYKKFQFQILVKQANVKRMLIIARGQKDFEKYNQLHPIQVKIEDDKVLNILINTKEQLMDLY